MSAALCVADVDCGRELVRAAREPRLDQRFRHLDVALEADVPAADHIGLMRVERVGEHGRRAGRQREGIVVPFEGRERGATAEPFAPRGNVADVDVEPADLGDRSARDRSPQRLREELPAETVAEHRDVVVDRRAQQRGERRVPGQAVVHAHRAAHQRDPGERARIGRHRRALVERDELPREPAGIEPVGEIRRAFGARKAKDRDRTHRRSSAAAPRQPASRAGPSDAVRTAR